LELNLTEITPPKDSRKPTKTESKTKENLNIYRDWLLELKIIDPACGSGAFLNQALEYLLREHKNLTVNLAIMGDLTAYYDIESSILEHNLYGVDINEDAVEIARLSLWLRTAVSGRTLTNLSDKIVCRNSLLDFPFDENSFDVVIGNPPYVRNTQIPAEDKNLYDSLFYVADGQYDLYILFNELALKLSKINGMIGFIQPNKFLSSDYGLKTVNFIFHNSNIHFINNVSLDNIFSEASVYPYIFIFEKKSFETNINIKNISIFDSCKETSLIGFEKQLESVNIVNIINNNSTTLKELAKYIKRGVANNKLIFSDDGKYSAVASKDLSTPYSLDFASKLINYNNEKYELTKIAEFNQKLIVLPRTTLKIRAILIENYVHILDRIYYLCLSNTSYDLKFILAMLNSSITTFFYEYYFSSSKIGGGYIDLKGTQIETLPIPQISPEEQQPFIELVDEIMNSKESIKKYQKHYESMNAMEKIEIKEAIEKLENRVSECEKSIDSMVYELYGLSDDEIGIVEGN